MNGLSDEQSLIEIARDVHVPVILKCVEKIIGTDGDRDAWQDFVINMFALFDLIPNPPKNAHTRLIVELRAFSAPIHDLRTRVVGLLSVCVGVPVKEIEAVAREMQLRRLKALLAEEDEQ